MTGGVRNEIAPCGCPVGTAIEVRNLFYNTPVRRKFLRASQTEIGHASEAFTRIALVHPQLHFTLRHNDRTLFDLPPTASWRERIGALVGRDLEGSLIPIDNYDGEVRLSGFVADPQHSRANNRMQYLFLNGRHIRDRALQHALGEAYRGLLLHGRFPIAFLRLEVPAEGVDVNVHPTKLEVRFADSGRIYSLLLGTIRKKFLATDLTAKVRAAGRRRRRGLTRPTWQRSPQHRRELVDWAKGGALDPQARRSSTPTRPRKSPWICGSTAPAAKSCSSTSSTAPGSRPMFPPARQQPAKRPAGCRIHWSSGRCRRGTICSSAARPSHLGFQIHNRYLVTQNEEGMVVIDQHALHERILYEQLREKILGGNLETQRLLVPEPVPLPPADAAAALEARETLAQLGIEIEPFGGDTVLVSSYPAMLANLSPADVLRQLVEELVSSSKRPDRRDLLDELLHMIACKAAVKAGDHLAPEEITVLLEQRQCYQDAHHCPHGRPTALVFTREELDRRFKRH